MPDDNNAQSNNNVVRIAPQYITAIIAGLCGLANGVSLVPLVIDPSRNQTIEIFYMPKDIPDLVYENMFGTIVGTIIAGYVSDYFGPKRAVQLTAFPLFMSRLITAYWRTIYGFYAAIILHGFAAGLSLYAVVNYSIDIADKKQRGSIAFTYCAMYYLGVICAHFIGCNVNDFILQALIPSVVPVIYLIALSFVPESPVHMCVNDDVPQARSSLQWLRGPDYDIGEEMAQIELHTKPKTNTSGNVDVVKFLSRRTASLVLTADSLFAVMYILFYIADSNLKDFSMNSLEYNYAAIWIAKTDQFKLGIVLLLMLLVRKVEITKLIQGVFYISASGMFFVEVMLCVREDVTWIWPIALINVIVSFGNVVMVTLLLWQIFDNIALKSKAIPTNLTMQFMWIITCQTMPDYEIPSIYVTMASILIAFVMMKYALANLFKSHSNSKVIPLENVI